MLYMLHALLLPAPISFFRLMCVAELVLNGSWARCATQLCLECAPCICCWLFSPCHCATPATLHLSLSFSSVAISTDSYSITGMVPLTLHLRPGSVSVALCTFMY